MEFEILDEPRIDETDGEGGVVPLRRGLTEQNGVLAVEESDEDDRALHIPEEERG